MMNAPSFGPVFLALAFLVAAAAAAGGCTPSAPDVDLDTPEHAARSVGRILCAEHETYVDALRERIDDAISIQEAKAEVLADDSAIDATAERLERVRELLVEDTIEECKIHLVDMVTINEDSKKRVSLKVIFHQLALDPAGRIELDKREVPVLLTVIRVDDEWRVSESNFDFTLPQGAFGELLD